MGPAQAAALRAVADHDERQAEAVERLDGDVEALVRHQLRDHQVVLADLARPEAVELHGRMQHVRLAAEAVADARRGEVRARHVAIHALGRVAIPLSPALQHHPQRRSQGPRTRRDRGVALVPRVAERVVAVTDVHGPGVGDDAVRPCAGGGDHELVAAQVERLDGPRVERQQRPEGARRGADTLEERGARGAVREAGLGPLLVVDRGEDVGLRPGVADGREHALRPAQVEQEVVHERHAGSHRNATLLGRD